MLSQAQKQEYEYAFAALGWPRAQTDLTIQSNLTSTQSPQGKTGTPQVLSLVPVPAHLESLERHRPSRSSS